MAPLGHHRYVMFLVQIVSNKNKNIISNTIEKIENSVWISLIFYESRQKWISLLPFQFFLGGG